MLNPGYIESKPFLNRIFTDGVVECAADGDRLKGEQREMTIAGIRQQSFTAKVLACVALLSSFLVLGSPSERATTSAINTAVANYISSHLRQAIPLIIQTKGSPAPVEREVSRSGGRVEQDYRSINGFSATVNATEADRLNHDSRVQRVNFNAPIRWEGSAVDSSNLQNRYNVLSRIPTAWANGLDGNEVQVAVIDSGVWPHDDLIQKSPRVPGNIGNRLLVAYTNSGATDALDHVGHGTHVAGIIGGNGYDSNGQYIGVAPNALLVGVKIANDLGSANEGDVITGLEWVLAANQHNMHIRVVNLSLSSTVAQSYNQSALDAEVEKVWASGVVVVAASGNNPNGVNGPVNYAPGNDPYVITVGSIDDNYQTSLAASQMASWALYGATQDGINKPDVVADGSHVVSLLAPGSTLTTTHPLNIVGTSYFKMGGTSMAAPQVSGLVALMLQANPSLTNGQVKRLLKRHAVAFSTTAYTSWLGTPGGYADQGAIGQAASDDNTANTYSASYNPTLNQIAAGGAWWSGVNWTNVSWNNVSWNNVSWNSSAWANVSWNGVGTSAPTLVSIVWSNVSWNNVSWNNVSWNNVSWNNVSWNNVSWNNVSWNGATFQ
jgi:serine protease AprX